jgi:serine/threonine protein kinase
MLIPNQTVGPYTLIRPLGQGAFGSVWLAERRGLITTQVALKIPRDASELIVTEVTQEAQVWQQASGHPNVLPVIECALYDGHVVIVSEFVAEGTLEDWLARQGGKAPSTEEAIEIVGGILAGLEHLHRQHIIHRDLKPANVMLQGRMPRLTDFGLARGRATGQTQHITGTMHYMAPEMFSGNYSPQSDLWAAGVILYELLSGALPFPQERIEMLIPAIVASEPLAMPVSVSPALQQVVAVSLRKDPAERFHSASEMRAAMLSAAAGASSPAIAADSASDDDSNPTDPTRVVILYKRNAQPDGHVLLLLETELTKRGYHVFVDRHMTVGIQWAKEIERQIRTAGAVIPLLSASSVQSEMLAYELKIAQETVLRTGRPHLLPIRVAYSDPLAGELEDILSPIQYASWDSPSDDQRLADEILLGLQNRPSTAEIVPTQPMEAVGGAVNLDSHYWIVRPTEMLFRQAVARHDSIVLLKGARQMGKTSLLARGLQQAREAGSLCVRTDFQKLNAASLESIDALFQGLIEMIADQLDLEYEPDRHWNPRRGANVNLERFLRREVLGPRQVPVMWAMDEVDRLFSYPFGSEVFGLFRSWHNERSLDPTGPWSRLTLAIAYATEAHLFITDVNQSPFNVGTRLLLEDLSPEQVAELNRRYGSPLRSAGEEAGFYRLLSGQPYLSQRGLNEMVAQHMRFAAFETAAGQEEGMFGDHLRRFLVLLVRDPHLCDVMRAVLRGQPCPSAEYFYKLRSAGVLAGESISDARPRCQLYADYLKRHLL